eukprot:7706040-Alexandrium_andersonii.AAC.1
MGRLLSAVREVVADCRRVTDRLGRGSADADEVCRRLAEGRRQLDCWRLQPAAPDRMWPAAQR